MRQAAASGEAEAEALQRLEDRLQAAEALRQVHRLAARTQLNLPPYDELIDH
ncbi:hypothetical protein C7443_102389 [Plasticicumulans acidivorans]|uniref:Uncharacterized protein n=1 Tax=Plasticicumulans acidivorans TaxID=886464 RepID=A0A317N035_9GAMM|nr:hypothetical protein C7443_102389 [Plasticicumulans acidivorans]